jgi:hypothetical protein
MTNRNINTGDMTNRNINTGNMTNNNISTGDMTNRNINNSTSASTNTNISSGDVTQRNINSSVSTSTGETTNTNNNNSVSSSTVATTANNVDSSTINQTVSANNSNKNINESTGQQSIDQTVHSPPPSAMSPSMMSYSQDVCTSGASLAIQTQIFGFSGGKSITDDNCELMKLSKTLYDMGMRVASVSLLCQDERVWQAMEMAGTPCPYEGLIGDDAKIAWAANPEKVPGFDKKHD